MATPPSRDFSGNFASFSLTGRPLVKRVNSLFSIDFVMQNKTRNAARDRGIRIHDLDRLISSQKRALEADLKLARQIQEKLLPEHDLAHGDWEISHYYELAGLVSGDYCDLIPACEGVLYFILGDVSGKGIAASMLMAHLHAMFRSLMTFNLPLAGIVEQASDSCRV